MTTLLTRYQAVGGNWVRESNPIAPPVQPPPAPGTFKPDGTNTGYSWTGAPLVNIVNGDMTIRTPGVYEGYDIRGFLKIETSNVTFRKSRVRGRNVGNDGINRSMIFAALNLSSVLVEDVEVYYEPCVGVTGDANLNAIGANNVDGIKLASGIARRCHSHHVSDTFLLYGNGSSLEGCYAHDNVHLTVDPYYNNGPSHDDGVQIQGGANHRLYANNILGGYNGGLALVTQDVDIVTNLVIEKNWGGYGGATVNISEKGKGPLQGLQIIDNRFYGNSRLAGFDILIPSTTRAIATITGNVRDADGSPAQIHNG